MAILKTNDKLDQLKESCKILKVSIPVSYLEIKENYRKLIKKWHPDKCKKNPAHCKKKTIELMKAYNLIIEYMENYKFSFNENINSEQLTESEWWFRKFGDDPLWGRNT